LFVTGNNFTALTLPPDMTQITSFGFLANPLITLVLPEPLSLPLADTIEALHNNGVLVLTYPVAVALQFPRATIDGFNINATGPPGVYKLFSSDDLVTWTELTTATNTSGAARFDDPTVSPPPQRFYRVARISGP